MAIKKQPIKNLNPKPIETVEWESMSMALLNSLPLCIKWFDSKGNLISINKGGREEHYLAGKSEEEIKKWNYATCIEEKYIKTIKNSLKNALKGIPSSLEMEHVPGTATSHWCFSDFTPVLDQENKVKYVLFVSRDITQTKIRLEELKEHAQELEKINQLMIGRENKMLELKKRIAELELQLKIKN